MLRQGGAHVPVITGIGVISPNGSSRETFWQACLDGVSGVRSIPAFLDAGLEVTIAGNCEGFDGSSVLPARDGRRVSRTAILALAAAREALQHARLYDAALAAATDRTGVILGTGGGAADFAGEQYRHFHAGTMNRASAYAVSGSTMGGLSSELSIALGIHGPSQVVTSGCASSTDATLHAARLVRDGEIDIAITGGADAPLTPAIMAGFCLMGALATGHNDAPSRASRPFQHDRNGFVLAEGAWILVVESEASAQRRGVPIIARILAGASTCDAFHRVQTEPTGGECARAMRQAIDRAGLRTDDIGHLTLHGTGTRMNDATEFRALAQVFGDRLSDIPAHAPKSLVGHPQGAAGALGVVLAALGLARGVWPVNANQETPDPSLPLDLVSGAPRAHSARFALCNCLAFGSKNSVIVLGAP